jgi:Mg2+ and Co2+ transporter CorA
MEMSLMQTLDRPRQAIDCETPDAEPSGVVRALLFESDRENRELNSLDEITGLSLSDSQILWVDLHDPSAIDLDRWAKWGKLPSTAVNAYSNGDTHPEISINRDGFWSRVVAVNDLPGVEFSGSVLAIIASKNLVITLHSGEVDFLEKFREGKQAAPAVGNLSSASIVASLLDWHLSTYFDGAARFEIAIERLEVDILSGAPRDCVEQLRRLRKAASRLRRMLAPHRVVFSALPRPDFMPQEEGRADRHFQMLDSHFERAMDIVENARELVVGSFELFSSQTALEANRTMRVLTFVTVVIGVLAVIGGILGMNFHAPLFDTGVTGFLVAVGLMVAIAAIAVTVGHKRHWY